VIIATAGHVDHGKTSLIRQLTGVETDRLAEEKRRGLSINLGYAYLPLPGGTPLGFIDVPGHQRFINTMISGISGIDMGMLVVAADDGAMPQTHEHLDVLELLGVEQLSVVITKIDRVSQERVEEVLKQLRRLLTSRPWAEVDMHPVSNHDGTGVAELQNYLLARAARTDARESSGYFRLSIDRAFTIKGAGLVVTGTASAGSVNLGDKLTLLPANTEARVRGIRAHDQTVESGGAGQRIALNISGKLDAASVERGDWLVAPQIARTFNRLDVSFSLLPTAPFALKNLAPVKLHIGAKRVAARLAILSGIRRDGEVTSNRLQPGTRCLAQLILEGPAACIRGERFLLRDQAENLILGGGVVLDPQGSQSGKGRPERLDWLRALQLPSAEQALARLIAENQLVDLDHFQQICNLREDETRDLLPADGRLFTSEGHRWIVSHDRWTEAEQLLMVAIDNWHREEPQAPGIKMTRLKPLICKDYPPPLAMAALVARLEQGALVLREGLISRAGFQPAVSPEASRGWQKIEQHLKQGGNQIPLLSELAAQTGIESPGLGKLVKDAAKTGKLCTISDSRYALPEQLMCYAREVLSCDSNGEPLSVINLKARFGCGRNLTVEILEYFDRVRFTQRRGDTRVVLNKEVPLQLFKK
jgi:selenocysteine-specific elongation factor